jgi:hypothetical protein
LGGKNYTTLRRLLEVIGVKRSLPLYENGLSVRPYFLWANEGIFLKIFAGLRCTKQKARQSSKMAEID